MNKALMSVIFAAGLATAGCDVDVNETAVPSAADDGVSVDIDTPAETRMDRREERRENLRDAIDNVNVNVDDGGVTVDVDGE